MKKNSVWLIVILFLVVSVGRAQTWSPVSTGIKGSAANTTWALFPYDSMLFAGGWFSSAGSTSVNSIAQWDGSAWSAMNVGTSGYISAFAFYNGNIYAGGEFDTIGGIIAHDIAMWNGSTWSPVGKGIRDIQYGVYTMTVYKGELYAGGSFDSADGKPVFGIAKWNGTSWSAIGSGVYAADEADGVFSLCVYNGYLYVGGGFDSAGGVPVKEIARWDGTNWSAVGGSMNDGGTVNSLTVYNGNLYAGGMFDTAGSVIAHRIAMWNGSAWAALDSGIQGEAGWAIVSALASYNGKLYAGGYFDTVNKTPINCIASWDGSNWSSVGNINSGGSIDAMCVFGNSLYVGGGFDSAGGVAAKNIAMLTTPNSINEITVSENVGVFPNPSDGKFAIELSVVSGQYSVQVYNVLGEKIYESPLNKNSSITTISLPIGPGRGGAVYFYRITDEHGQLIGSGKLVKE